MPVNNAAQVSDLRPTGLSPVRLADLAADLAAARVPVDASEPGDIMVSGITLDSSAIRPGDVFAATPGANAHGAVYADSAVAAGAVAILTDSSGAELVTAGVPVLVVDDVRGRLGQAAAYIYHDPGRRLDLFGVTGTNGKTTTAYLIDAVTRRSGPTGLIGTVATMVGDREVPSVRTTPEACDLQALFAVMTQSGVSKVAMEVSSHALAMGRVDGAYFSVAGFTNLSHDHLDFHHDMDAYFAAKAELFTAKRCGHAIVMVDDEYGRRLARLVAERGVRLTTVSAAEPPPSEVPVDVQVRNAVGSRDGHGSRFDLVFGPDSDLGPAGETWSLTVPLPGGFNVANAALAAVMLAAAGTDVADVRSGLAAAHVPGRMQHVGPPTELAPAVAAELPSVFVDYAHTPAAIDEVLRNLRAGLPSQARMIAVLGCGGDRDAAKRPDMGAAAARWVDAVLITDDNPRSEDPALIRAAAVRGAQRAAADHPDGRDVYVRDVPGRAAAIELAIQLAGPADTVAILGKGHEKGQEIAGVKHPFDDVEVAAGVLAGFGAAR